MGICHDKQEYPREWSESDPVDERPALPQAKVRPSTFKVGDHYRVVDRAFICCVPGSWTKKQLLNPDLDQSHEQRALEEPDLKSQIEEDPDFLTNLVQFRTMVSWQNLKLNYKLGGGTQSRTLNQGDKFMMKRVLGDISTSQRLTATVKEVLDDKYIVEAVNPAGWVYPDVEVTFNEHIQYQQHTTEWSPFYKQGRDVVEYFELNQYSAYRGPKHCCNFSQEPESTPTMDNIVSDINPLDNIDYIEIMDTVSTYDTDNKFFRRYNNWLGNVFGWDDPDYLMIKIRIRSYRKLNDDRSTDLSSRLPSTEYGRFELTKDVEKWVFPSQLMKIRCVERVTAKLEPISREDPKYLDEISRTQSISGSNVSLPEASMNSQNIKPDIANRISCRPPSDSNDSHSTNSNTPAKPVAVPAGAATF